MGRGNPNPPYPEDFGKTFTKEEYRENGRKGGIASGKAKAKKRRSKEILEIFLNMPINSRKTADIEDLLSYEKLKGKNITVNEAIQLKQVQKALQGNLNSATYIRDTIGDKPVDKVENTVKPIIISGEDELSD